MGLILINDSNYREHIGRQKYLPGAMPRVSQYGDCHIVRGGEKIIVARPVGETRKPYPRSEWPDRIRAKDAEGSWLENIVRGVVPCRYQNGYGYCHAYSATTSVMDARAKANHPFKLLSPFSVGGPITGWRNRGMDIEVDLKRLVEFGACEESYLPSEMSLDYRRWKDGWEQNALLYRVVEWDDLEEPGGVFDWCMTYALDSNPYFGAFSWWEHAIAGGYRAIDLGRGKFAIKWRNSHGKGYGDDGFFDMQEGKGTPDWGVFAPRSIWMAETAA